MSDRGAKHRENAVTGELRDVAIVAMDRIPS
jgi:hypothetical protein